MFDHLPKRIVFTRHPQCAHNVDTDGAIRSGIMNRDSPLTDVGELQCSITAAHLQQEYTDISSAFCSTFARTHHLPIAAGFADILSITQHLDERNMGVWHTKMREEVLQAHPDEEDRLKQLGYHAYTAPEGESCVAVEERLSLLLSSSLLGNASSTVYLSGHGISGICLRRLLLGESLEEWVGYERLKNASVTVFERTGEEFTCTLYNHVPWEGQIDPELLKKKSVEA